MPASAIVAEVGPPTAADEPRLASEELAIDVAALGDDFALPFPQGPVPPAVGQHHVAAVVGHHFFGRETADATVQEGQKPYLAYQFYQLCAVVDFLHRRKGTTKFA